MDAIETFREFKAAFPNSNEVFNPTDANINRWKYHLRQRPEQRPTFKAKKGIGKFTQAKAISFFEARRARVFNDLEECAKEKYLHVASLFPGRDVWACGSWVNGDYLHPIDSVIGDKLVMQLRKVAGKHSTKTESDYDFWIERKPDEEIQDILITLPSWADLMRHPVDKIEMILVPGWDFTKLPKAEHQTVLDLFAQNERVKLMQIHNKYKLSPTTYCCDSAPVMRWFKWAIEEGVITNS